MVSAEDVPDAFARRLLQWHDRHGRHDLPWQNTRDPYRVWLSEIMLQQTQVGTVIGYYERFLQRFPDVGSLAAAPLEAVLALWAGLGYYARARLAHRCAQAVASRADGRFPRSAEALARLPGIGPSTAAAIAAFCFDERVAILDGNVKRVLARYRAIDGDPRRSAVLGQLWDTAHALLPPAAQIARYTQAIMDLGATVCTRARPRCAACPVHEDCAARRQGRTAELPARAPRAQRPERRLHLLVALRADAVLVEERPPAGIWGGLLSLPEFPHVRAVRAAARALGGATTEPLPERRHAFTHLTLVFTPHLTSLPAPDARLRRAPQDPGYRWLPMAAVDTAALPAPIRRLLRETQGQ